MAEKKKGTWNPALHPRDSKGRFTRSASKVMKPADVKLAKKASDGFNPTSAMKASGSPQEWMQAHGKPLDGHVAEYLHGDNWKATNAALRAGKPAPGSDEIDAAMQGLPEDALLRREIPLSLFAHIPMKDLEGMKVRDAAYASTTLDVPGHDDRPDMVTMHIAAPAGTKAIINAEDGEILLARDTEVAISKAEPNGKGGWDLYGVVIPKKGAPGEGDQKTDSGGGGDEKPADEPAKADAGKADTPAEPAADQPAEPAAPQAGEPADAEPAATAATGEPEGTGAPDTTDQPADDQPAGSMFASNEKVVTAKDLVALQAMHMDGTLGSGLFLYAPGDTQFINHSAPAGMWNLEDDGGDVLFEHESLSTVLDRASTDPAEWQLSGLAQDKLAGKGPKKAAKKSAEPEPEPASELKPKGGTADTAAGQDSAQNTADDGKYLTGAGAHNAVPKGLFKDGTLTAEEKKALGSYESGLYSTINSYLRKDQQASGPFDKQAADIIPVIDQAMAGSELSEPIQVYRGMYNSTDLFGEENFKGDLSGFSWQEKGYGSTTSNKAIADAYKIPDDQNHPKYQGTNVQMAVRVPAGVHALETSSWAQGSAANGPQAEITLERGLAWKVVKDNGFDSDGIRQLDVEIVHADSAAAGNGSAEGGRKSGANPADQPGQAGPADQVAPESAEPKPEPKPEPPAKPDTTPKHTSAPVVDVAGWKQTGGQGGSNPGGTFQAPDGTDYYVKKRTELQAENEALAAALYQKAGVDVPDVSLAKNVLGQNGAVGVASKIEDGKKNLASKTNDPAYKQKIYDGFVADAWLANWDTAGLEYDNIIEKDGKPLRVDVGGSLLFRAQGAPKGDKFGATVGELDTLRDPKVNPQAAKIFGDVDLNDKQQMGPAVKKVLDVSDSDIDNLVDKFVTDGDSNAELKSTLKARREDIRAKLGHLTEPDQATGNQSEPEAPAEPAAVKKAAKPKPTEAEKQAALEKKWKDKPAPKAPVKPKPPEVDQKAFFDGWLAAVTARYDAQKTGKKLEQSYNYQHVQKAIEKPGTGEAKTAIKTLLDKKYIDAELEQQYHDIVDHELPKPGTEDPAYVKALKLYQTRTNRHKKDVAAWKQVNGVGDVLHGMAGDVVVHESAEDGVAWADETFPAKPKAGSVAALKMYTGSSYSSWNAALRKNADPNSLPPGYEDYTKKADAGMSEFPEDVILNRGTNFDEFVFPDGTRSASVPPPDPADLIGSVQVQHGYMSTSVGGKAAFSSHKVQMTVRVPKGHKGAWLKPISKHKGENELLLQRSTQVFIHDAFEKDGKWIIEAEVLPSGMTPEAVAGQLPMPMSAAAGA